MSPGATAGQRVPLFSPPGRWEGPGHPEDCGAWDILTPKGHRRGVAGYHLGHQASGWAHEQVPTAPSLTPIGTPHQLQGHSSVSRSVTSTVGTQAKALTPPGSLGLLWSPGGGGQSWAQGRGSRTPAPPPRGPGERARLAPPRLRPRLWSSLPIHSPAVPSLQGPHSHDCHPGSISHNTRLLTSATSTTRITTRPEDKGVSFLDFVFGSDFLRPPWGSHCGSPDVVEQAVAPGDLA